MPFSDDDLRRLHSDYQEMSSDKIDAFIARLKAAEAFGAQAEIVRLSGKTGFCLECEEQARLLEKSESREAKLITELTAAKAEIEERIRQRDEWRELSKEQSALIVRYSEELKRLRGALDGLFNLVRAHQVGGMFLDSSDQSRMDTASAALDGGKL